MIYDGGHETDEVYNTEIKWMNMKLNMIHMSEDSNVNSQAAAGFACCLVLVLVFSRHTHTQNTLPHKPAPAIPNADRDSRNK